MVTPTITKYFFIYFSNLKNPSAGNCHRLPCSTNKLRDMLLEYADYHIPTPDNKQLSTHLLLTAFTVSFNIVELNSEIPISRTENLISHCNIRIASVSNANQHLHSLEESEICYLGKSLATKNADGPSGQKRASHPACSVVQFKESCYFCFPKLQLANEGNDPIQTRLIYV